MKRLLCVLALALLVWPAAAGADEVPVPPPPGRWATDTAGFLSPAALEAADRTLRDYERATGNQVLVWIGSSTGDTPLEDWTVKAFERWKVGRAGLDNGLVFFIFAADRRVRLEVGYGLEDEVPDAVASRILAEDVLPRIRAGDRDGAVLNGIAAIQSAVSGTPRAAAPGTGAPAADSVRDAGREPARPSSPAESLFKTIVVGLLVVGFLILLVTNPSLALYILFSILSSGGGGGGRSGGGGWSGGGGRSGGGGASGSW